MRRIRSKKKLFLIIAACVLAAMIIGDWVLSVVIYDQNFNKRFDTYEPTMFRIDDFDGLQRTRYAFSSDDGQELVGYLYSSGRDQHGIIILAHGLGGGHNSYMDCIDYFSKHGYYVFAYDATGSDESAGKGPGGIPQGVTDLDYAISYVETSGQFPKLPIALFGHSWGGYSVGSALFYHPEIKAVISCSGFNKSADIFKTQGKTMIGESINLMIPFVKLHERIKFGKYASVSACDGFSASDAAVMIVHSSDDEVVPTEYGYDVYYERFKDDPRFRFVLFEDKGHNYLSLDTPYMDEFNAAFDEWRDSLEYDYSDNSNKDRFAEDKAEYIVSNLDRKEWCCRLDTELFDGFLAFYNEHIDD